MRAFKAISAGILTLAGLLGAEPSAQAGNLITLANFNYLNGAFPVTGVTLDGQGNIYGTTAGGGYGVYNDGTVFEINHATGALTTIVKFNGTNGQGPDGKLSFDAQGNLYGTTSSGGASNRGTLFEINHATGALSTLVNFNGTNGASPSGQLAVDGQGNIYGTSSAGGPGGGGTVYEFNHASGTLSTLAAFSSNAAVGGNPVSGITLDSQGNLYGTGLLNGSIEGGKLFEINHATGALSVLHDFGFEGAGTGGYVFDSQGNLYGVTTEGELFELVRSTGAYVPLGYVGGQVSGTAGLVMDSQGNLYGTTELNTVISYGSIFEYDRATGKVTGLAYFTGTNGAYPFAGLTFDGSGDLYGTTDSGGAYGTRAVGTVFELTPPFTAVAPPPPPPPPYVPEPSTFVMLAVAAGCAAPMVWRRGRDARRAG